MERYFKVVNPQGHHGMIYKEGINADILDWESEGSCNPGGLYFASTEIFEFLGYGTDVYEVFPIGEVVKDGKKFKAHALDMKFVGKVSEANTFKILLDAGADVHSDNDYALRFASGNGQTEVVKMLLKAGADIHAEKDYALRFASRNRYNDVVKLLLDAGADIHKNVLKWVY